MLLINCEINLILTWSENVLMTKAQRDKFIGTGTDENPQANTRYFKYFQKASHFQCRRLMVVLTKTRNDPKPTKTSRKELKQLNASREYPQKNWKTTRNDPKVPNLGNLEFSFLKFWAHTPRFGYFRPKGINISTL